MKNPPQTLFQKARDVLQHAYCPYSSFPVAACVETPNGNLYAAVNVENACYNLGTCAETNAIAQMISQGETTISRILILTPTKTVTPPCGGCRQRIAEFAQADISVHLCSTYGNHEVYTIGKLIPAAFGPNNMEPS